MRNSAEGKNYKKSFLSQIIILLLKRLITTSKNVAFVNVNMTIICHPLRKAIIWEDNKQRWRKVKTGGCVLMFVQNSLIRGLMGETRIHLQQISSLVTWPTIWWAAGSSQKLQFANLWLKTLNNCLIFNVYSALYDL